MNLAGTSTRNGYSRLPPCPAESPNTPSSSLASAGSVSFKRNRKEDAKIKKLVRVLVEDGRDRSDAIIDMARFDTRLDCSVVVKFGKQTADTDQAMHASNFVTRIREVEYCILHVSKDRAGVAEPMISEIGSAADKLIHKHCGGRTNEFGQTDLIPRQNHI